MMEITEMSENIEEFARRLTVLEQTKKNICDDIKSLIKEFKELGLPVRHITDTLSRMK
jgi:uncharacterized protein (UPF0335 family)